MHRCNTHTAYKQCFCEAVSTATFYEMYACARVCVCVCVCVCMGACVYILILIICMFVYIGHEAVSTAF